MQPTLSRQQSAPVVLRLLDDYTFPKFAAYSCAMRWTIAS